MSHFQDEVTLFFGTPVVTGVVAYLIAHLTGIIKVLRGGTISVEQVKEFAEKVDPKLVAELEAKLASAEAQLELRVKGAEDEVQARLAAELDKAVAFLKSTGTPPAV